MEIYIFIIYKYKFISKCTTFYWTFMLNFLIPFTRKFIGLIQQGPDNGSRQQLARELNIVESDGPPKGPLLGVVVSGNTTSQTKILEASYKIWIKLTDFLESLGYFKCFDGGKRLFWVGTYTVKLCYFEWDGTV